MNNADDLKTLRKKCGNSVHVAVCVYCKDLMQLLCRIIFTMIMPFELNTVEMPQDAAALTAFACGTWEQRSAGLGSYLSNVAPS